ncbi:hypothetical protein J3R30DRAFT_3369633 [Lentinula aciculospora]|uniref:RNA polymerase II-associated protein 3 n=1 Tax=Lentinula aciculospora TaxID=153920 RepID=A0A9W9AEB3_9AGAR|nr:hypothetical protein J3R30DRAFT_3369633 [Lentinula aciculospora]
MSTTKAQQAKDKGNNAFKNGDFPSAIGHYAQAILEDPTDWTFPLNRAAAYLKLGKNEDAERDCTTVLTLNTSNVKALFRRAQARRGLEKLAEAQNDLEQAIALDPSNQSVKSELSAIKDLLWKKSTSDVVHPMRRRIPIQIIEPSADTSIEEKTISTVKIKDPNSKSYSLSTPPTMNSATSSNPAAVSLETATVSFASSPTSPVAAETPTLSKAMTRPISPNPHSPQDSSKPNTSFQAAKRARNEKESNASRVGGGIFRASGKNTIFAPRSTTPNTNAALSSNDTDAQATVTNSVPTWGADVHLSTATTTLFEFTIGWNRLSESSVEERFRYIMRVAPSSYPSMIQNSLEPPLLIGMFRTFHEVLDIYSPSLTSLSMSADNLNVISLIASVLRAYLNVRRIRTVVMFLGRAERDMMRGVVEKAFRSGQSEEEGMQLQREGVEEEATKAREAWRSMLK